jgi:hypothetical protein
MTNLEQLARKAEQSEHQAAEARAALEQAQAEREQARHDRLLAHDRRLVETWEETDAAIQAEESEARAAFLAAVAESPPFREWVRMRAARWRRVHLRSDVARAMHFIGEGRAPFQLEPRDPRLLDELLEGAERAARELASDEQDKRSADRESAGGG